jgi:hypothetical protein
MVFADSIKGLMKPAGIVSAMNDIGERQEIPFLTKEIIEKKEQFFRCSKVHNICPREEVLCAFHRVRRQEIISSSNQFTFDIGRKIHDLVRVNYLGPRGILLGKWLCPKCGAEIGDYDIPEFKKIVQMPKACQCGYSRMKIVEPEFYDEDYLLGGHTDGIIITPSRKDYGILEIKSQKKEYYDKYSGPTSPDITQINLYMWQAQLKWGELFYINKNDSTWKVHFVEYDPLVIEEIKQRITKVISAVNSINEGMQNPKDILPDRMCQNRSFWRAANCQVRDLCFQ